MNRLNSITYELGKGRACLAFLLLLFFMTAYGQTEASAYSDVTPSSTTLYELVGDPASFDGQLVSVEGVVVESIGRTATVQLVNGTLAIDVEPGSADMLAGCVGQAGTLTGRFVYGKGVPTIEAYSFDASRSGVAAPAWYTTGSPKLLVIPVYFSDMSYSKTPENVTDIASWMADYYLENSFGKLSFDVWYLSFWSMMPKPYIYYGTDSHFWEYVNDAIRLVDPWTDFNDYKFVIVVHAGGDEAMTGNSSDIWSMAYYGGVDFTTNDGNVQLGISTVSEFDPMGTFAHEVGHELGLPDLYDYNQTQTFVGPWDLMDSGGWNGVPQGTSPAHFTSYGKVEMGWLSPSNILTYSIGEDVTTTLYPLEVSTNSYQTVKITISGSTYYLIEVRKKVGYDSALPGEGVLILYVDESLGSGEGIVRVKNPSLSAFGVGGHYQDDAKNVQIDVVSSAGSSYTIHVSPITPLMNAYFTSIRVTSGNSFIEMISGGVAKVYSYQAPVWVNLTFYNGAAGTLGADLFAKFTYRAASGGSWEDSSSTIYVPRQSYGGAIWYWPKGIPGPDTYYVTVRLYFNDSGAIKLEDQKEITISVVYLSVGNWSAHADDLAQGSSTRLDVSFGNSGNDEMYDVSIQVVDSAGLIVSPSSVGVGTISPYQMKAASFTVTAPSPFPVGNYSVRLKVSYYDFRGVYHEEYFNSSVTVRMTTSLTLTTGPSAKVGQNFTVSGQLLDSSGDAVGGQRVGLYVDGSLLTYLTTDSTGFVRAVLNFTKAGAYRLTLTYEGSSVFFGSTFSVMYEVRPLVLSVTTGLASQKLIYIDGSLLASSGSGSYTLAVNEYGERHNLTAVDAIYPSAGTRYIFVKWFDGALNSTVTSRTLTVTVTADRSIDSIWQLQYLVSIDPGEGEVDKSTQWVNEGASILIRATDPSNFVANSSKLVFKGWTGTISSSENPLTVVASSPQEVVANWRQMYYLTVASDLGSPRGEGWYASGDSATIGVSTPLGFLVQQVFDHWEGDATSTSPTTTVVMDGPKVVTAVWRSDYTQLLAAVGGVGAVVLGAAYVFKNRKRPRPAT